MNVTARILIILAVLPFLPAPAQEFGERGPMSAKAQARLALTKKLPDLNERDVLLITLDATLLKSFPIGGKGAVPMPNFQAFAAESSVFSEAWSVSPNRLSGLIAIHHSLYPSTVASLASTEKTSAIATYLADVGFSSYSIARDTPLESLENVGEVTSRLDIDGRDSKRTRNPALIPEFIESKLNERRSGERLFGWIHLEYLMPPANYHPGFSSSSGLENHYAAALQTTDTVLGQIAQQLDKSGARQRTIVILTGVNGLNDASKIGDEFRELSLLEATLHVPLVVYAQGLAPAQISATVETIDIAPTILELAGTTIGDSMQGRSFIDLLANPKAREGATSATYAELLEWRGESKLTRRHAIQDGRWLYSETFLGGDQVLFDRQSDTGKNLAATKAEVVDRLRAGLEDLRVYATTTGDLWDRGTFRPLSLTEPRGQLGRAEYLNRLGEKAKAEAIIKRLIAREGPHLADTIATAIEANISAQGMSAPDLLKHQTARIRGLAGAWLAMDGSSVGLDHALASLQAVEDKALIAALLKGLGTSGLARAKEAIAAMELSDDDLAARRDLALIRLGDDEALARLPMRFLSPRVSYDRLPFLSAIAEFMPEKLVGLSRIYLEDGDGNPRLVRAVLGYLDQQNAQEAAPSLAQAISLPDLDLRVEIVNQLGRWQSFAAAGAALELGSQSSMDAAFAAQVMLRMPGLLSSPFAPSLNMTHYCARFEDQKKRDLKVGAELTGNDYLEFTLALDGLREGRCVLLFKTDQKNLSPDAIKVTAQLNDSRQYFRTESLSEYGGIYTWVGQLRSESLEAGLNKFQVRLRPENDETFKAWALGFVVLANQPSPRQMIAGLDTDAIYQEAVTRSGSKAMGDAESYKIFMRRFPFAAVGGEIRVLAAGRTFARFALREITTPRTLEIALPDWAGPDSLIELQAVDVPKGSGLTALLYGLKKP